TWTARIESIRTTPRSRRCAPRETVCTARLGACIPAQRVPDHPAVDASRVRSWPLRAVAVPREAAAGAGWDLRPFFQGGPMAGDAAMDRIDTSVPHSARIWNYWLGGKDNYPVDRAAGDQYKETFPGVVDVARASRLFLTRSVRHLAGEAGVRQFLGVGTGLPTVDNTREVAQRIAPDARIVYVDNDPLVLVHARALLTSTRPTSMNLRASWRPRRRRWICRSRSGSS